jgi:hypothetical protein
MKKRADVLSQVGEGQSISDMRLRSGNFLFLFIGDSEFQWRGETTASHFRAQ